MSAISWRQMKEEFSWQTSRNPHFLSWTPCVHEHSCAHTYEAHQQKISCTTAWKTPKDCKLSNHCPVTLISFSQIWVKGLCLSMDCLTCKSAHRLAIAFNSINRFEPFIMFLCKVTQNFGGMVRYEHWLKWTLIKEKSEFPNLISPQKVGL